MALTFGWRIAAGVVIGYWLDGWLGTTPVLISVMSIGALVSAVADMLRIAKKDSKSDAES